MSDLAYNINGEAFEVPIAATGWRVRRMKPRGAPEVVYGHDGIPLIVPIDSDLSELRRNVDSPGRFRLDAVDDRGRTIEDVPAAYLMVANVIGDLDSDALANVPKQVNEEDGAVREAMRLNTELAKSVIDRFPEVMHAAAELLRAADGAGLPARLPRLIAEEEVAIDEEVTATSPALEMINTLVAQVVPIVVNAIASKGMPNLGSMLDWRKAAPANEPAALPAAPEPKPKASKKQAALPPIDPKNMAHFIAIQSALAPNEAALARRLAAELTPEEIRAWLDELAPLSVPDAVAKIRKTLADLNKGGES
ncbi:MAG: hypothetical protein QM831_31470 [Kofleriaceae bacterium]